MKQTEPAGRLPAFGFTVDFAPGDRDAADRTMAAIARTGASLVCLDAAALTADAAWADWLLPALAGRFAVVLRTESTDGLPALLERYGAQLRAVLLPMQPADPVDMAATVQMVRAAGLEAVLSLPPEAEPGLLRRLAAGGALAAATAVGLDRAARPGTADTAAAIAALRSSLEETGSAAAIWLAGAEPLRRHDEARQAAAFRDALAAPVSAVLWDSWQDQAIAAGAEDGDKADGRGALAADGTPRLLARLLTEGGPEHLAETLALATPALARPAAPIVIAGGSGFIGSNLAESFLKDGRDVVLIDNLSRPGVEQNLAWLKDGYSERVHIVPADIRDTAALEGAVRDAAAVFHLAAQVAVTTSLDRPVEDFEVNARGTINLLEAVRRSGRRVPVIFASTNKVYGNLADLGMDEGEDSYTPADPAIAANGIGEWRNLDFCTPYGCSKGVADQYVLDYAKSYDLPTAVLRMSCIYGPRQFGTEDQGWVAHFLIRALKGEPITIYGDGKQVRDILHVHDAVAAYRALLANIGTVKGQAFNLGGGPANAVSLRVVLSEIERLVGRDLSIGYGDTRQGDQTYFVADTRKLESTVGWQAKIGWRDGLNDLYAWLRSRNRPAAGTPRQANTIMERRLSA
ncbi:NAD-dependent epimerase/dehydratase family protein [Mangrovicella endophytica]|uniref:NAD-dependent epimerase/dehydratase family protein n=1 Tax=Mangrovicella endophytica TaxID=2066697 RepID=UPI0018E4D296|nr:NAD-dependent epimerase/dehydratase family protein [Mangrovicella endophytica]